MEIRDRIRYEAQSGRLRFPKFCEIREPLLLILPENESASK